MLLLFISGKYLVQQFQLTEKAMSYVTEFVYREQLRRVDRLALNDKIQVLLIPKIALKYHKNIKQKGD